MIRRTSQPESADRRPQTPLARRTDPGKDGQDRGPSRGPLLRRPSSPQNGPLLRRAGPPGSGQPSNRGGGTGGRGGFAGSRPAGALLIRREGQGQGQGQRQTLGGGRGRGGSQRGRGAGRGGRGGSDRRLRKAPEEEEEFEEQTFEQEFRDYVDKYVDRPANPTEPLPYNPAKLTLDDLKSDWPNTLLSTSGMTESVIQKVQWLARRLPHGYQSPEQIAEHYLKGNLTRFESEEERKTVLKLAAEFSAKTKTEKEDGTLHKHETPRFAIVEDPAFTSIASKAGDKGHIMATSVRGDYDQAQQQKYAFMQTVDRVLGNNETYGPAQSQKLLARVQALIPQSRTGGAQQTKKA